MKRKKSKFDLLLEKEIKKSSDWELMTMRTKDGQAFNEDAQKAARKELKRRKKGSFW